MDEKVLTVRQPWARLLVAGIKRVENRTWTTRHRGRLWIHAAVSRANVAKALRLPGVETMRLTPGGRHGLTFGAIIGSVQIVDVVRVEQWQARCEAQGLGPDVFASGPYCWVCEHPRMLAEPIVCKGALSLWKAPAGLAGAETHGPEFAGFAGAGL